MSKLKKDARPLLQRLWTFQNERAPLYAVAIMAAVTVGSVYVFSEESIWRYLGASLIIALYLLQTRTADEAKDFEHDNKFHPDRPVQRGVVSLDELAVINKLSIAGQLILYATFMNLPIFLFGLLSQGYAVLTRNEFFVRDWIRQHFWIYYLTHYMQLVILFYVMSYIINPIGESKWSFVLLIMLCVITSELGRKMFSVEKDTTDDTFSAQMGHKGSAIAVSGFSVAIVGMVFYLLDKHTENIIFFMAPLLIAGSVWISSSHYAQKPDDTNADWVEKTAALLYVVALLSVIVGVLL